MNAQDEERMKKWIRDAVPAVTGSEPSRDLWPEVLRRLDAKPEPPPWFDWVLAGGILGFVAFAPASIPILLYYL